MRFDTNFRLRPVRNIDVLKPLTVVMPKGERSPLKAKVYTSYEMEVIDWLKKYGIECYVKINKK